MPISQMRSPGWVSSHKHWNQSLPSELCDSTPQGICLLFSEHLFRCGQTPPSSDPPKEPWRKTLWGPWAPSSRLPHLWSHSVPTAANWDFEGSLTCSKAQGQKGEKTSPLGPAFP